MPSLRANAEPATYWVSPAGNSNNPCTEPLPCRLVNDAYQKSLAGDVIKLVTGVHDAQSILERSLGSPNVIVEPADATADVRFDGSLYVESPYVTLRGVRGGEIFFKPSADFGVLEDAYMIDGAGHVQLREADNLTVRNSTISGGFDLDPLQIVGGDGHLIEGNVLGGVELDLQYHSLYQSGAHPSTYPHPDCVQIMGGKNIVFRNNRIFGCWTETILIKPDFHPIENLLFENNFIQDCVSQDDWCAAYFAVQVYETAANSTDDVRFVNNTIDGSVIIRAGTTNNVWRNNIVDTFQAQPPIDPATGSTAWTSPADCGSYGSIGGNLIRTDNCDVLDTTNLIGTPTYVELQTGRPSDITGPDLHLASTSLGLDAGLSPAPEFDIDGGVRLGQPDIGADEYGSVLASMTTTSTPTTTSSVPVSGGGGVLFVAGSTSLNAYDVLVRDRLVDGGYDVTVVNASVSASDVVGKDLIVVSYSVSSSGFMSVLDDVSVPIVTWDGPTFDDFGIVSSTSSVNKISVTVVPDEVGHPLLGSLSGTISLYTGWGNMGSGVPGPGTTVLAKAGTKPVLFVLPPGAARADGTPAPACRIGYPLLQTTKLTPTGWTLFDQTITHATNNCDGTTTVNPTTSSTVPATTTTVAPTTTTVPVTTTSTPTTTSSVPVSGGGGVLFVAGSTSLNAYDVLVRDRLVDGGYDVTVVNASVSASDVVGKDLIVVSYSVSSSGFMSVLDDVSVPIVTWDGPTFDDFGIVSSTSSVNKISVTVVPDEVGHPLLGSLSGTISLYTGWGNMGSGVPGPGTTVLAKAGTKPVLFVLPPGAARADGTPAPACRIGYPLLQTTKLTPTGWTLFDQTITHATNNCDGTNL